MITPTRSSLLALSTLMLAAASPSLCGADPTAPSPPGAVATSATTVAPAVVTQNPGDKIVCKTETPAGSRLGGKRVCMKKSDWAAQSQNQADQVRFRPPAGIGGAH